MFWISKWSTEFEIVYIMIFRLENQFAHIVFWSYIITHTNFESKNMFENEILVEQINKSLLVKLTILINHVINSEISLLYSYWTILNHYETI